ncbi:MAG: hypothetical protein AAFX46_13060 [Cyanobacteria bacterium J06636_27]
MNTSSRYWKIWRINPAAEKSGYKHFPLTAAKEFANSQISDKKIVMTKILYYLVLKVKMMVQILSIALGLVFV